MLSNDPGPGANPERAKSAFPAPLDFTVQPPGAPFLARFGPGFEWIEVGGQVKLVVMFAVAGGPVLHRVLEPEESARLLEWMLRSAEVRDGG